MIGWMLFGLVVILWWRSRQRNLAQRTHLADYILMLLLDEDVYRRNQEAFSSWLRDADGSDKARLWVAANTAMENAARNWAARSQAANAPTQIGVGEMVWDAKHGAKQPDAVR